MPTGAREGLLGVTFGTHVLGAECGAGTTNVDTIVGPDDRGDLSDGELAPRSSDRGPIAERQVFRIRDIPSFQGFPDFRVRWKRADAWRSSRSCGEMKNSRSKGERTRHAKEGAKCRR